MFMRRILRPKKWLARVLPVALVSGAAALTAPLPLSSDELYLTSFRGRVLLQETGNPYRPVEKQRPVSSGSLIRTGRDSEAVLRSGDLYYKLYSYSKASFESAPSLIYGRISVSDRPEFDNFRFFYTPSPVQGKTLRIVLLCDAPVSHIESVIYNDAGYKSRLTFYPYGPNRYRALTGFDVEAKPDKYYLRITAGMDAKDMDVPVTDVPGADVEDKDALDQDQRAAPPPSTTTILYPFYLKRAVIETGKVDLPEEKNELLLPSEQKEEEIRTLLQVIETNTPDALWEGSFSFPVENPQIISSFGKKRSYFFAGAFSFIRFHRGIDIRGATGDPVYAPSNGVAVLVQNRITTGNTLVLDHGQGVFSLFFHLDSVQVQTGDRVEAGDRVATIGSTGFSAGPHLHWSLIVNGVNVDPTDWITRSF
jgi:murein DD-endopeptidase MepM/ murein hydrolase activator NlpD